MRRSWIVAVALLALTVGCSDDKSGSAASSTSVAATIDTSAVPRVDLIDDAIKALETELGGPQRFFEINATPKLVNLFLSLNDGAMSQAWVYFDGELSSQEARPASGHTFASSALKFDGDTVLDQVRKELPTTRLDVFEILGGVNDAVQYTLGATSAEGGGLIINVAVDGKITTVAPA